MMLMTRKFLKQISSELITVERRHDPIRKSLSSFCFILVANVDGKIKALRKEKPASVGGAFGGNDRCTGKAEALCRPPDYQSTVKRLYSKIK